jgi:hypothetical protein
MCIEKKKKKKKNTCPRFDVTCFLWTPYFLQNYRQLAKVNGGFFLVERKNMILSLIASRKKHERQPTNQFFWWPGGFCPLHPTPLHGKTPLLHWHQKKVPIPCLSHEFNLDTIEKNYSQDPPLSIYLKKSPFAAVRCPYVMSLFKNITPKFWCVRLPSTPNPKWRKGCGGKIIGVAAPLA